MPTYTAGKPSSSEFFVPAGDYKFKVVEATEDTSKAGNEMIKLKLKPQMPDGREGPSFFDYLVFNEKSFWKVDAFLKSCDQHPGEGEETDIKAEDLIGYEGEVSLTVETFEGKKSNKVAAYLFEEF
jgi:hypothetical protein